ncbi:G-protein coupled receptor 143-like [Amphiura filiformis]|uniref:G-protein coupled receptor 143-like n=1 Tax=Amphiura filiformis TaxID=82378 RepID=UPI003B21B01B
MASPTLDLLCCQIRKKAPTLAPPLDNITVPYLTTESFMTHIYSNSSTLQPTTTAAPPLFGQSIVFEVLFNVISIMAASLSIMGAIYTLIPKRGVYRRRRTVVAEIRQTGILTWLAVTDLMACLGIFMLAVARLSDLTDEEVIGRFEDAGLRWFCVVATAWIQYFYISTFLWTFSYALDVHFMLTNKHHSKLLWLYAAVSFVIPLVLVIIGEVFLYRTSPYDQECAPDKDAWKEMLPHYLAMYIPMLFVMVANPILYWQSFKKVGPLLMASGMYTDRERKIKTQIQVKFLRIVLVFYICWTANIINVGTLIFQASSGYENIREFNTFSEIVWIVMAVFNPLQAFLNALVYWGPAGCRRTTTEEDARNPIQDSSGADSDVEILRSSPSRRNWATERSPLLQGL